MLFRKQILIADILILFIGLAGIYHVSEKAGLPVLFSYSENNEIIITTINPSHKNYPLHSGDIILRINGKSVHTIEELEFLFDGMAANQHVEISFRRNGEPIQQEIKLEYINSFTYLAILTLVGIIFWALGLFVLQKRSEKESDALVFHWISISVALHIMTTFGIYGTDPFFLGYFIRITFLLASSLTPILFIHFSFLFPKEKKVRPVWILKGLYGLATLFFLLLSSVFIMAAYRQSIDWFHYFMILYNAGRWFFALCLIFGVNNFIKSYVNAIEESERRKLRWVILGLAIGPLSFAFLWQIPQALTSVALVPEEAILLISALTPLTFAISIVRYHILDIDFIFNRSSVYIIVLTLILIIYSGIVALTVFIVGSVTVRGSLIISAIAAVIIALLFEPVRESVQKFVDQKFFRVRYNYRIAQRELSDKLNRFIRIKDMAGYVCDHLSDLINPEIIAFISLGKLNNTWNIVAQKNFSLLRPDFKKELTKFTDRSLSPLLAAGKFVEPGINFETADESIFKRNKIVLVFPLRFQNSKAIGYILLGKKKSAAAYSFEDIDLLKTISAQLSLAMERIWLSEDLLLKQAEAKRLDELNRMKTFFVSSVSHDLQTPLTSIRMFAELLQAKKDLPRESREEYLEIIQGETERLSRLINNVLDFSRVERGVKNYHFEDVVLNEIVLKAIKLMDYQVRENGFVLETKINHEPVYVSADNDAIVEALTNLISNAIKYSAEEKYICISMESENDFAVIRVRDKGIGISHSEQNKIFETFYRSTNKKIQSVGGAGLGLSLVRHIAEAHNGSIKVESEPGAGSVFSLSLPLASKL